MRPLDAACFTICGPVLQPVQRLLEILENGELVFDYNGSIEECLDWLNRLGRR